jgi:hypothetical protein
LLALDVVVADCQEVVVLTLKFEISIIKFLRGAEAVEARSHDIGLKVSVKVRLISKRQFSSTGQFHRTSGASHKEMTRCYTCPKFPRYYLAQLSDSVFKFEAGVASMRYQVISNVQ